MASIAQNYSNIDEIKIQEPLLAKINIVGVDSLPTTKDDNLHAWIEYTDENGVYFKKRIILNAQGASSLNYTKKNLSIDFCEDEWIGDSTTSIRIGNWVKQDGFHFKAGWLDTFRSGLAVATAYKFYDDIAKYDTPIYIRAALIDYTSKALYHPDGFPCIILLNGNFQGIYAWQLKKHRKNMNMEKDNAKHVWFQLDSYTNSFNTGEMNWNQIDIKNPKIITDESKEYIKALANYNKELTALEKISSVETMREEISARYDVVSVINMILHGIMTSNIDGFGKNVNFFTFDGKKWFVMPYDLDMTFGNSRTASFQFPASWSYLSSDYTLADSKNKQPFYWISKYFWQDIKEKYKYLRDNSVITTDNIIKYLINWNTRIGPDNYNAEYTKWSNCPSSATQILSDKWEFISDWSQYFSKNINDYDASKEYNEGDICRYDYRLWKAKQTVTDETPVVQKGYTDTEDRVRQWLDTRIKLEDSYFGYEPTSVKEIQDNNLNKSYRKILLNGHLYIVTPTGTYTIIGTRLQ